MILPVDYLHVLSFMYVFVFSIGRATSHACISRPKHCRAMCFVYFSDSFRFVGLAALNLLGGEESGFQLSFECSLTSIPGSVVLVKD